MKSVLLLSSIYVGSVIGAGFSSGQEIWQFFSRFGKIGIFGIVISSIILAVAASGIFIKLYKYKIKSYLEYSLMTFGKKAGKIVTVLGNIFMFCTFCVMLAGSGAIFLQETNQTPAFGIALMAAICLIVFLLGAKGMAYVNFILSPIMLVGIIILGAYSVLFGDKGTIMSFSNLLDINNNIFISAIVYASYTLFTLPGIAASVSGIIVSKKAALTGGLLGTVVLFVGAVCVFFATLVPGAYLYQMPSLTVASHIGKYFRLYYGIVIYLAMITTAVSCGMGFIYSISKRTSVMLSLAVCIAGSILALAGFSKLISYFYTSMGFIGIIAMIVMFKDGVANIFNKEKY